MRGRVFVELGPNGLPITILKHRWQAARCENLGEWPRKDAVASIREHVFKRANWLCERCGARLTWQTMHMDEKVSKGEGGLVSLENCWALCAGCHILNPDSEHGNRRLGGRK